jgi:hypothetical protein
MNRRTALTDLALLMGGMLSAPTVMAIGRYQDRSQSRHHLPETTNGPAFVLTDTQRRIVSAVADLILPKTDTVGAIDVGVPQFIEMMLADCYRKPEHVAFMSGLNELETGQFLSLTQAQQVAALTALEAKTKELMRAYPKQTKFGDNLDDEQTEATRKGLPFWRLIKELTLLGYYTSEAGIKASFEYLPIPGKYEPIKLKTGQKTYIY